MRAVQGRGLPGSSSQWNGTEAEVWSGGVSMPEGSGDSMGGTENRGSLGVELALVFSASDPITLFLCVCFFLEGIKEREWFSFSLHEEGEGEIREGGKKKEVLEAVHKKKQARYYASLSIIMPHTKSSTKR